MVHVPQVYSVTYRKRVRGYLLLKKCTPILTYPVMHTGWRMKSGTYLLYVDRAIWQFRQRLASIIYLFIYLFIYYMVYVHVKSFTIVKNRKCGQVTSHCRKARPYRADLSLFLNVPVVTVKSEVTVWGRLFQTVGEAWQKACLEKFRTDALLCRMLKIVNCSEWLKIDHSSLQWSSLIASKTAPPSIPFFCASSCTLMSVCIFQFQ